MREKLQRAYKDGIRRRGVNARTIAPRITTLPKRFRWQCKPCTSTALTR